MSFANSFAAVHPTFAVTSCDGSSSR